MLETSALKLFTVASLCFKLNSVDDTKLPTYRVPVSNERCALILFTLDIYGLLLFLGVDPYCHQKWWKSLLFEPYRNGNKQPLYELLAKILWRSVKKDVIHEVLLSKVFVCVILRKGISTSYWWKGGGEGAKQSIKLHLIEVLMQLNSSLFHQILK